MARKSKKLKKSFNKKALSSFFISFFLFVYLAILTSGLGFLGDFFSKVSFTVFGIGSYAIFPIIILNIIFFAFDKMDKEKIKSFFFIYLTFFSFLIVVGLNLNQEFNLADFMSYNIKLANIRYGVGILGGMLTYLIGFLIGKIGSYILFAVSVLLTILSIIKLPIKDFLGEINASIKKLFFFIKRWVQVLVSKIKSKAKSKPNKIRNSDSNNRENLNLQNKSIKPAMDNFLDENDIETNKKSSKDNMLISNYRDRDLEGNTQISIKDFDQNPSHISNYRLPPLELLKANQVSDSGDDTDIIERNARAIETTLQSFNIESEVVQVNRGPRVTSYELKPQGGVKVSSIVNLQDNLALSLASSGIRIEAPIPGKAVVGIEVPNKSEDSVGLKEIIGSQEFQNNKDKIPFALGKDIQGESIVTTIEKMPHLLIAGATGSGKSVCINTLIMSILYSKSPDDVKLILIDPKMVELNVYNGIPHLVIPVVTDPKKASAALNWAVREMERRYEIFSKKSVRDITSYKESFNPEEDENLPYIVIVIDELSDLMMVAASEVEDYISRLAQMSRACGIHLVIATQRPSVDVITGTIKANIPSRISFSVSSQIDSRTILDMSGAEKLLGKGDMLFYPSNYRKPKRIQGAYISDQEVENIVTYIKNHSDAEYNEDVINDIKDQKKETSALNSQDEFLSDAIDLVISERQASVSLIQRRLQVGYARAGRIIDQMEELGVIEGHQGSKPRSVLVNHNVLKEDENEHSE